MKKVELLSPAGNMECLKAAIEAGCDAVYLGGKLFGARSFAGNFSNEELIEAIKYAHLYGVKVYLTINTIVYEREVERFLDYIRFVHKNNVDAVIVQDIGMLDLITKKFPNLEVHASTQMHVHNKEGIMFAKEMNVKRVVIARETTISEIKKIKREVDVEIEAFVHGALCVSYSGQCLMSALIGNRSGNRGTCAQVCRKKYDLYSLDNKKLNEDKYLLSTKDLCTVKDVGSLIEAGVDSLKIEGRMKRAEYVYLVTKTYRKAIDNYYESASTKISNDDILELKKMFNRDFTKGFIFNENNDLIVSQKRPNHQGVLIGTVIYSDGKKIKLKLDNELNVGDGLRIIDSLNKKDVGLVVNKMSVANKVVKTAHKGCLVQIPYQEKVTVNSKVVLTTDYNQIKNINNLLSNPKRKVLISARVVAKKNQCLKLIISDGKNEVTKTCLGAVLKAISAPVTKQVIEKQIAKLGNTVYRLEEIKIDLDEGVFINIKNLNELRRMAILALNEKRLYKIPYVEKSYQARVPSFKKVKEKSVLLSTKKEYDSLKDAYDVIYTTNQALATLDKVILKLPRVVKTYPHYDKRFLIGEVGGLFNRTDFDTDFSFNVVNSYAVAFLHERKARRVTLSYELTLSQIKDIIDAYHKRYNANPNLEVIIRGYPEAMISKFDLNKMYNVKESYLKDEYGNKFRVVSNDDFMTIYNYQQLSKEKPEKYYDAGVNGVRTNL